MRKRAFLMLGLAFVLAIGAVFLARGWLQQQVRPVILNQQLQAAPAAPTKTIVVARARLAFGHKLRSEHVREIPWAADALPEGAFETVAQLFQTEDFRVVLRGIEPNEPVLKTRVSGEGGRGSLSAIISDEMRAITIRVNDVHGVGGFILPGDHVDVLLTRDEKKDQPITDVLLQKVKVLGIDQEADDKSDKPKVARAATIEVSPRQAQKVTLASRVGTLSLALRRNVDIGEASARTVRVPDLRVGEVVKPVDHPKPVVKGKGTPRKWKRVVRKPYVDPFASVKVVRGISPQQYKVTKEGEEKKDKPVTAGTTDAEKADREETPAATGKPVPLVPEQLSDENGRNDGSST